MKLLLDTHIALWLLNEHEKLSQKAKDLILNDEHDLFISISSFWEIAIKVSIGKLTCLDGGVSKFISKVNNMPIEILPITQKQTEIVEKLPYIHRDPFDRILIATAVSEESTILTNDENIHKYNISCLW